MFAGIGFVGYAISFGIAAVVGSFFVGTSITLYRTRDKNILDILDKETRTKIEEFQKATEKVSSLTKADFKSGPADFPFSSAYSKAEQVLKSNKTLFELTQKVYFHGEGSTLDKVSCHARALFSGAKIFRAFTQMSRLWQSERELSNQEPFININEEGIEEGLPELKQVGFQRIPLNSESEEERGFSSESEECQTAREGARSPSECSQIFQDSLEEQSWLIGWTDAFFDPIAHAAGAIGSAVSGIVEAFVGPAEDIPITGLDSPEKIGKIAEGDGAKDSFINFLATLFPGPKNKGFRDLFLQFFPREKVETCILLNDQNRLIMQLNEPRMGTFSVDQKLVGLLKSAAQVNAPKGTGLLASLVPSSWIAKGLETYSKYASYIPPLIDIGFSIKEKKIEFQSGEPQIVLVNAKTRVPEIYLLTALSFGYLGNEPMVDFECAYLGSGSKPLKESEENIDLMVDDGRVREIKEAGLQKMIKKIKLTDFLAILEGQLQWNDQVVASEFV